MDESFLQKALELPPIERAALAQELLTSLDKPDQVIDKAWQKEAEKRFADYKAGKAKTVSLSEVLAKYN